LEQAPYVQDFKIFTALKVDLAGVVMVNIVMTMVVQLAELFLFMQAVAILRLVAVQQILHLLNTVQQW
jgi:hypothetical protein